MYLHMYFMVFTTFQNSALMCVLNIFDSNGQYGIIHVLVIPTSCPLILMLQWIHHQRAFSCSSGGSSLVLPESPSIVCWGAAWCCSRPTCIEHSAWGCHTVCGPSVNYDVIKLERLGFGSFEEMKVSSWEESSLLHNQLRRWTCCNPLFCLLLVYMTHMTLLNIVHFLIIATSLLIFKCNIFTIKSWRSVCFWP